MSKIFVLLAILGVVCVSVSATGATRYVDGAIPISGDGTSWETAFKSIQEGISFASSGDTVIVAEETYVENIRFSGKNIVLTSTDPLDPDVVANTIVDGNQAGPVVSFSGTEDQTCILAGFTIQNGRGEQGGKYGGGIYGQGTHATIQNNAIVRNRAPST